MSKLKTISENNVFISFFMTVQILRGVNGRVLAQFLVS
jgi:hypothetical protein